MWIRTNWLGNRQSPLFLTVAATWPSSSHLCHQHLPTMLNLILKPRAFSKGLLSGIFLEQWVKPLIQFSVVRISNLSLNSFTFKSLTSKQNYKALAFIFTHHKRSGFSINLGTHGHWRQCITGIQVPVVYLCQTDYYSASVGGRQ